MFLACTEQCWYSKELIMMVMNSQIKTFKFTDACGQKETTGVGKQTEEGIIHNKLLSYGRNISWWNSMIAFSLQQFLISLRCVSFIKSTRDLPVQSSFQDVLLLEHGVLLNTISSSFHTMIVPVNSANLEPVSNVLCVDRLSCAKASSPLISVWVFLQ